MMEVIIPVAPISRKIVETEKGKSPIALKAHDLLYEQLNYQKRGHNQGSAKHKTILTDEIRLQVSAKKTARFTERAPHIGYHLYRVHMDMMCRFVFAQWNAGIDATRAIDNFYFEYGIEEDDFPHETAYKRWQRFKWEIEDKKPTFFCKKSPEDVLRFSKQSEAIFKTNIPLSDQDEVNIHNRFFKAFYYLNHDATENHLGFFPTWLLFHYSSLSAQEVADRRQISLSSVYYQVRKFNDQLSIDQAFNQIVSSVIAEVYPS